MNKNEIKQIILEEIKAAINEMASPEELAADSRPEDDGITPPGPEDMPGATVSPFATDQEARIARAMETGDEDELEDLAAGELDRAGLEEMARTSNIFKLSQEASLQDVLQFMQRVNDVLKTYKSPGQKRPKKRFTPEEMKALATAMLNPEGFTSKDVIASTSYNSPAQANKFLKALEMKGLITLTSQLKKAMEPTRDPNAPETRGRKRRDSEFDMSDDPMADLDALGLGGDIDLSDPLAENNNTMNELEKYIKQVIKEAKNADAEKKLKALIAKGVSQSNEELEEEFPSGIGSKASYDAVHMTNPNAFKGLERTISNIADTLQTGVADLLNISPDMASNVILAAVPASVIVGLAAGAAKGRDRELIPDVVEKFILKFANKFRKAGKEIEFGQGGTYNTFKKYDGVSHFKKFNTNENTVSELEKYIKQQIREAKNPLAKKMKEIETQGRVAALETKLAAVAEMIEETEGRLTRIDEDNEFRDMMDKNAVKEVRKQLKELERAQAKLQKEYDKVSGGRKKEKVVDEVDADKLRDLADRQDALDQEAGEVEEVSLELNESTLRMQKLAGLITESELKKKLSLKENEGDAFLNQFTPGTHAYNVVGDGKFFRVSQFGSGYDENPPVNVMDELKDELAFVDKDSQDYDDLMMDLEAAREIAQVVAKMGGRVSDVSPGEGNTPDLEFVYSVNQKGDLIGQAILR